MTPIPDGGFWRWVDEANRVAEMFIVRPGGHIEHIGPFVYYQLDAKWIDDRTRRTYYNEPTALVLR